MFLISAPGKANERNFIRQTWGRLDFQARYSFQVIFFVGRGEHDEQVQAEHRRFGDLIIALVHTIEGKTIDDKRQMANGIANAIVDGAEIDISRTRVGFREYPKDSYASAGILLSD